MSKKENQQGERERTPNNRTTTRLKMPALGGSLTCTAKTSCCFEIAEAMHRIGALFHSPMVLL